MSHVSAYDAKTHLPELIRRAASGERIVITRYGTPIAVLSAYHREAMTDVGTVISNLRTFRRNKRLGGESLRRMIEEGRR